MQTDIQAATRPAAVRAFLAEARIARLATSHPDTGQPHVVPVWYEWDGETLWISSFRATRKVRELLRNPRCSIVIDADAPGESASGVIFEGRAELRDDPEFCIPRGFRIYARYLGEEGAGAEEPQSWLHDPDHLLIVLRPEKVSVWGF